VEQGDAVLRNWMVSNARLWGARTELVAKADAVMEEFALAMGIVSRGPVTAAAQYDETALRLDFTWAGEALPGAMNSRVKLGQSDAQVTLPLSTTMLRHQADHLASSRLADGRQRLTITLDDL
jgi:hypothetical protein